GNPIQDSALRQAFALERAVKDKAATLPEHEGVELVETWRRLLTSDHFYYMCTKYFADGDVHKYFNPYESPYDAHIIFMNVLADLAKRVDYREPVRKGA
ncbi:MAG TPA: alpha-amylase, partial [Bdellovibrionota bacterium]|nr:alpha-amylase [Bdellovibrionota bacterium]